MDGAAEPTADTAAVAQEAAAMNAENTSSGAAAAAEAPAIPEAHNPLLDEYNKLLQSVTDKPDDFNSWTSLLSTAEKLDDLAHIRSAYDAFFVEYPLCYGYWKKYAEAERRHGSLEAAVAVYERGVAATPYSTDLWVAYGALLLATDAETEAVRSVYERGLQYVGTDWLSHSLWDKVIEFEGSHGSPASVASLYSRALHCPIKDLDKYRDGLVSYASSRTAHELLSEEASAEFRSVLQQQAAEQQAAAAAKQAEADAATAAAATAAAAASASPAHAAAVADATMDAAPGTEAEPTVAPGDEPAPAAATVAPGEAPPPEAASEQTAEAADTEMTEAEAAGPAATAEGSEPAPAAVDDNDATAAAAVSPSSNPAVVAATAAAEAAATAAAEAQAAAAAAAAAVDSDEEIKRLWLQQQEAVYAATKVQQELRKPFESAVRRPYWHIKPLDAAQLKNWVAYLDWQDGQGDVGACVRLYECCVVPCANYPEFWQRYVQWCETHQPDAAAAVLARAVAVHCKRRSDFLVFAARFYEARGDAGAARELYQRAVTDVAPGLMEAVAVAMDPECVVVVQVVLAAANFERRMGDAAAAAAVFEQLLEKEQATDSSSTAGFVSLLYANFLREAYNDIERARQVLQQGLEASPDCQALWEGAVFFEETLPGQDRVSRVMALFDQALAGKVGSSSSSGDTAEQHLDAATADGVDEVKADGASAADTNDAANGNSTEAVATATEEKKKVLSDEALEELSKRCIEFADMYADLATLRAVQQRHSKLFMLPASALAAAASSSSKPAAATASDAGKKRPADGTAAATANGHVAKVARTDTAAAAHPAAAAAAHPAVAAVAAAAHDHSAATGYYPPPPAGGYGPYGMPPPYGYGHPSYPPPYGYGGYDQGYDRGYDRGYGRY